MSILTVNLNGLLPNARGRMDAQKYLALYTNIPSDKIHDAFEALKICETVTVQIDPENLGLFKRNFLLDYIEDDEDFGVLEQELRKFVKYVASKKAFTKADSDRVMLGAKMLAAITKEKKALKKATPSDNT